MGEMQNNDVLEGMMRRLLKEQQATFETSPDGRTAAMEGRLKTELLAEIRVEVWRQVIVASGAAGSSMSARASTAASSIAGPATRGRVEDGAPAAYPMRPPEGGQHRGGPLCSFAQVDHRPALHEGVIGREDR